EAAHGVAVREHDPREAALTAPEDDARDRRAGQLERAVRGADPEARVLDPAAERVAAPELRGVDVGAAAHLLRETEMPRLRDVGRKRERPHLPAGRCPV